MSSSTNPEQNLSPADIDHRNRLEAIAQDGLDTYLVVDGALAEIRDRQLYRDSHDSFDSYVRERWGVTIPDGDSTRKSIEDARVKPCEALARACDETLAALAADDRLLVEIRLAVHRRTEPDPSGDGQGSVLPAGDDLLPTLRWLLSQATGTVGDVAHRLERRAADIDDGARAQLRSDVLLLEAELAVVKALLTDIIDWDWELERLLNEELPDLDPDPDAEDEE